MDSDGADSLASTFSYVDGSADHVDHVLQSLLLNNGLLEDLELRLLSGLVQAQSAEVDDAAGISPSSSAAEEAPGQPLGSTLRQLRRAGLLGAVDQGGQSTLLGGTLYEYSSSTQPMRASEARQAAVGSTRRDWEGREASRSLGASSSLWRRGDAHEESFSATQQAFGEIRLRLGQLFESENEEDLAQSLRWPLDLGSTAGTVRSLTSHDSFNETATASFVSGRSVLSEERDEAEALSHLLETELNQSFASPLASQVTPAVSSSSPVGRSVGIVGPSGPTGGISPHDASATWSDAGFDQTAASSVRTVFNGTMDEDFLLGGADAEAGGAALTSVLRRLAAADPEQMEEALVGAVRRVVELGTALSGGLCEVEIRALPKVRFGHPDSSPEEQQCSICLEDYQDGELLTELPRCRHFFHMGCIASWFQRSQQCPLCRRSAGETGEDGPSSET